MIQENKKINISEGYDMLLSYVKGLNGTTESMMKGKIVLVTPYYINYVKYLKEGKTADEALTLTIQNTVEGLEKIVYTGDTRK